MVNLWSRTSSFLSIQAQDFIEEGEYSCWNNGTA